MLDFIFGKKWILFSVVSLILSVMWVAPICLGIAYTGKLWGWENVSSPNIIKLIKFSTKLFMWKVSGDLPRKSLLPFAGANFVVLKNESQKVFVTGFCAIGISPLKGEELDVVKGYAECEKIERTQISYDFAGTSASAMEYMGKVNDALNGDFLSPAYNVLSSYVALTSFEVLGVSRTLEKIDGECLSSIRNGGIVDTVNCFNYLELANTITEINPGTDDERRLVALRVGLRAWQWMLCNNEVYAQLAKRLTESGRYDLVIILNSWRKSVKESNPEWGSCVLLSRHWGVNELEMVNKKLRNMHYHEFSPDVWNNFK